MILATTRAGLHRALEKVRGRSLSLGLIPTMGYLHEGHLSLVDETRERADFIAASVFVNPLQFGPGEDLDRYPRDLDRDMALLEARGVDLVFHPSLEEMYPGGNPEVTVDPGPMGSVLCGAYRPGHFRGVLSVVARLFGLFRPRFAAFGQKDYQQAVLIKRMVLDLEMDIQILTGEIVREEDGLAMSSRNVFLTPEAREDALGLFRGLQALGQGFAEGETSSGALKEIFREVLSRHPRLALQYLELVDPETLEPVDPAFPGAVAMAAGYCGLTRLIDNQVLGA